VHLVTAIKLCLLLDGKMFSIEAVCISKGPANNVKVLKSYEWQKQVWHKNQTHYIDRQINVYKLSLPLYCSKIQRAWTTVSQQHLVNIHRVSSFFVSTEETAAKTIQYAIRCTDVWLIFLNTVQHGVVAAQATKLTVITGTCNILSTWSITIRYISKLTGSPGHQHWGHLSV